MNRGIVHRDLKPAILLTGGNTRSPTSGWPNASKRWTRDQTKSGTIMGTPSYMAEQARRNHTVGPVSDLYTLGAFFTN